MNSPFGFTPLAPVASVLLMLAASACSDPDAMTDGISQAEVEAAYRSVLPKHEALRALAVATLQDHPFRCGEPTSSVLYQHPSLEPLNSDTLRDERRRAGMAVVSVDLMCPGPHFIRIRSSPDGGPAGFSGRSVSLSDAEVAWGTMSVLDGHATMRGFSITTADPLPHGSLRLTTYYSLPER